MTRPRSALLLFAPASLVWLLGGASCRALLDLEDPPQSGPDISPGMDCDNPIEESIGLGDDALRLPGSTIGGGSRVDMVPPSCDEAAGPERIYAVTAKDAGFLTARLSFSGTDFDSVLYAATACDEGSPSGDIECADRRDLDGGIAHGGEILSFPVSAGETRYIVVDGVSEDDAGDYELILSLTGGDDCNSAIPIVMETGTAMTLTGDTSSKTNSDTCTSSNAGKDVVYAIRGPGQGGLIIEVRPIGFDVTLYLRTICEDSFTSLTCRDMGAVSDPEGVNVGDSYVSSDKDLYVWVDSAATPASGELGGPYQLILTPFTP